MNLVFPITSPEAGPDVLNRDKFEFDNGERNIKDAMKRPRKSLPRTQLYRNDKVSGLKKLVVEASGRTLYPERVHAEC